MKKILMTLFILLFLIPFARSDWFYNSEHVTVNIGIYGNVEIVKTSPIGYVDSAVVNLTFFP